MLFDELRIIVKAGDGGDGAMSFFPGHKSGPDGGIGGRGGSVYAVVNRALSDLSRYSGKRKIKAEDGGKGAGFEKVGKNGEDYIFEVPVGTSFIDLQSQTETEIIPGADPLLLCKGGNGGRGNASYKTATNQVPRKSLPGLPGEEHEFRIIMRYIADFGLIGLPNAGKSSLLNALTAAKVKIASYPFTTLQANLGSCEGKIIADIPGLIEGASQGKGLGVRFLKHIEKVKVLFHCISVESADPIHDYQVIRKELGTFKQSLLEKEEIILLTKVDLIDDTKTKELRTQLTSLNRKVLPVTIVRSDLLQAIKDIILKE